MAFLKLQAIDESAVELQRLAVTDTRANPYQNNNGVQQFIINQTLMVRSKDVEKIRQAAQAVSELVDSGVILSSDYGPSSPTYVFTGLNDIKPEMIAEATASAREAAARFASDARAELGGLRRANQGVFQILARDQAPGITERTATGQDSAGGVHCAVLPALAVPATGSAPFHRLPDSHPPASAGLRWRQGDQNCHRCAPDSGVFPH